MSEAGYEDLIRQLHELKRTACLPVTEAGDGPDTASKFSGTPWLCSGESWPACLRCGAPMALFLQLNLATLPAEIRGELGAGLLQMFYCVSRRECSTQGEGCREPFSPYQLLRRVSPLSCGSAPAFPKFDHEIPARRITGWQPVEDYADRTEWVDLGIEADDEAADPWAPWGTNHTSGISSWVGRHGPSTPITPGAAHAGVGSGWSFSSNPTRTSGTCSAMTVVAISPAARITPKSLRSSGRATDAVSRRGSCPGVCIGSAAG
jgi:hypothetical protein